MDGAIPAVCSSQRYSTSIESYMIEERQLAKDQAKNGPNIDDEDHSAVRNDIGTVTSMMTANHLSGHHRN